MENPIHDLIIGNIQGARMPEERDFISDSNTNSVKPDDVFAAVQSDATTETHQTEVRHQPTTAETPNQNEQKEPKVSLPTSDDTHVPDNTVSIITEALPCAAVQTRGMTKKAEMPPKPLKVADITVDNVSADDMRRLQKDDETLKKYWDLAESNTQPPGEVQFKIKKQLLYREYTPKVGGQKRTQLMTPKSLRQRVMEVAHACLLFGHMSYKKTLERVTSNFMWNGCYSDVKRYCWSCDLCQRNISKGYIKRVPLGKMPLISVPFDTVCVDLVGPIAPSTERGHRYILTLIDMASRYPDAVPLRDIHTETVADALLDMYSRIGIPRRIHSDRGSQFTSEMMDEVNRLLSIKATTTTSYHPMGNSVVENFNKTLKNALKKMT